MKVLVAPGSFKESLDAAQVAKNVRIGLQKASKKYNVKELPLADGGSGTVAVLTAAYKGESVTCRVCGPLGNAVNAVYGWVSQKRLAIIELAQAAGLALVPPGQRDPCATTTKGVGELIVDAANRGSKRIILGVGDSATIDCGVGALSILGIQYVDKNNKAVAPNCRGLIAVKRIDDSQCPSRIKRIDFAVAADVRNVLTGIQGALVYARQKGATRAMIPVITKALRNFRKVVLTQYGKDLGKMSGSGAAGGVAGALAVIMNAELRSGFDVVSEAVNLEAHIRMSDLIITGEGRIDKQSFYGKAVRNVIDIAHAYKKPVILIAGSIAKDARISEKGGVADYYSLVTSGTSLTYSIKNTPRLLQETACTIGKALLKKMSLRGT